MGNHFFFKNLHVFLKKEQNCDFRKSKNLQFCLELLLMNSLSVFTKKNMYILTYKFLAEDFHFYGKKVKPQQQHLPRRFNTS